MKRLRIVAISLIAIAIAAQISASLQRNVADTRKLTRSDNVTSEHRTKVERQASTESPSTAEPAVENDEEKKTLAQQVADGKYGLIQNELFSSPSKRPGIISYDVNPEVPKDNVNNLGGLEPDEIWLAENHLLVLKGNLYKDERKESDQKNSIWPPIDNYIAPPRQVKIPDMPKVPPPFPVQLRDGGPVEFIKSNSNDSESSVLPPFFDPRFGPPPPFFPFPPFLGQNGSLLPSPQENSTGGFNLPPFLLRPPPGIGPFPPPFLPPPQNFTELDEDDPRIYYPPPYDFIYKDNYTSFVPPGPLVPGIVLPPPPDFFAPAEKNKTDAKTPGRTHTQKHSKLKPRPIQNFEKVGKTTKRPSKPQKNSVNVSIVTPKPTTSKVVISSTTDSIQNEIVPVRTLPQNTPVGEWVPIPAPRPFYVSEINEFAHQLKSNEHYGDKDLIQPHNYDDKHSNGYDYTSPRKKGRKYLSHEPAGRQYKPQTYSNVAVVTTTTVRPIQQTSIRYSYPTSAYNLVTTPNYYPLYDDRVSPFRKNPVNHYADYDDKESNEVNTVAPAELYDDVQLKTTPSAFVRTNLNFYRQQLNSQTTPAPIDYYYYDKRIPNNQNWGYPKHNVAAGKIKNVNAGKHITFPPQTKTEKPPIFEYSYSAPGYGTVESPKIGVNYAQSTTVRPSFYSDSQLEYFQPAAQKSQLDWQVTTPGTFHSSTAATHSHDYDEYDVDEYDEKPSNRGNKHRESYTTSYSSVFGQKLNENDVRGPTTPRSSYSNKVKGPNKHRVKFPSNDYYELASEAPYYQVQAAPHDFRPVGKHNQQQQNYAYPNYLRYSSPAAAYDEYGGYYGEDEEGPYVVPGHPLDSDINVNLNRPSTLIEPDAEYIDTAQIRKPQPSVPNGNTFISYRLPGSGGHFYFLTPQEIKEGGAPLPPSSSYQQATAYHHGSHRSIGYPYERRNIYPRALLKTQQQTTRKKPPP